MIDAVIFDMDGLLIDSEPLWRKAEKQVFAKLGVYLTDSDCFAVMGKRVNEVVALWYSQFKIHGQSEDVTAEAVVQRVIELINEESELLPGVVQVLEFLKKREIPLALASSSYMSVIQAVLNKFDLLSYFSIVKSAENEQFGKPHPALFINTAAAMSTKPGNCLVFEDSFHGVVAALAANMMVVAVPAAEWRNDLKWHAASCKLNSLTDFDEKLWIKLQKQS